MDNNELEFWILHTPNNQKTKFVLGLCEEVMVTSGFHLTSYVQDAYIFYSEAEADSIIQYYNNVTGILLVKKKVSF